MLCVKGIAHGAPHLCIRYAVACECIFVKIIDIVSDSAGNRKAELQIIVFI